jgi:hypothetical protein
VSDPHRPVAGEPLAVTVPSAQAVQAITGNTGLTPANIVDATVSDDGRLLAVANIVDPVVELWSLDDPMRPVLAGTLAVAAGPKALTFLHGRTLSVWGPGDAQLYDVTDPARPAGAGTMTGLSGSGWLRMGRDPRVAVTGGFEPGNPAQVWDMSEAGRPRRAGSIPVGSGVTLISSGSRRLAVFARGMVEVWDVTDPDRPFLREATPSTLRSASFEDSPDGGMLAAGSPEGVVVLQVTGSADNAVVPFATLTAGDTYGATAAFGAAGKVVVANDDGPAGIFGAIGGAVVWNLDPDAVYQRLCNTRTDVLTASDWRTYFPGIDVRRPCG